MSYNGYRLIINGITITNDAIQKGTYHAVPMKRVVSTWKDANRVDHEDVLPERQMDIRFSIRERNLTEQENLIGLFSLQENVPVTYWDDKTCSYKSGTFKMDAPEFAHRNTVGGINYEATPIHLVEY